MGNLKGLGSDNSFLSKLNIAGLRRLASREETGDKFVSNFGSRKIN